MRPILLLAALVLTGCADAPPPRPAHPRAACNSEPECAMAYQQAVARSRNCHAGARTGIGLIDAASSSNCGTEDASVAAASQRFAWFQQAARQQAFALAQQQALVAQQAAAQRAEEVRRRQEEERRAAEAARETATRRMQDERAAREAARNEAGHQREEADWLVPDVKGCAERGDPRACEALARFITGHPGSAHQAEAVAALQAGRDKIAAVEAAEAVKARRETAVRSAPRPAGAPPPAADPTPHVCCCDGSVSPDCVTPHAGCCDGHGGPCACK